MEDVVSREDLFFSSGSFAAVIAPAICSTSILSPRKWRAPSRTQFVCNSSFAGQQKVLSQQTGRTSESTKFALFVIWILSMFWEVHRNQEWEENPWSQWIITLSFTLPIAMHREGIALQILTANLMLLLPCLNPFTWSLLQLSAMTWVRSVCGKSKAFPASQFYSYCHKSLCLLVLAGWWIITAECK